MKIRRMNKTKKERRILANYRKTPKVILWELEYLISKLKTRLINHYKAIATLFITRLNERRELKEIERDANKTELTELRAKHHDRAIEKAKERGIQKAHGIKKQKSKLTEIQLKAIETRRKQLAQIGKNLSGVVGSTSMQPKKKKTKEDLKAEIERTKLEHELKELKKKPKTKGEHKGVQVGINPMLFNGGQSNALDNVLGLMGVQKKGKKNGR